MPIIIKRKIRAIMLITNSERTKFLSSYFIYRVSHYFIEACIFIPYGFSIIFLLILIIPMIVKIDYDRLNYILSFVILFAGFFGSYLGIPGNENIFLFRILIPVHLMILIFKQKKEWKRIKFVKWFFISYALFLFCMVLTLFWTPSISLSIRYLYFTFEWLYVIFLCAYYINNIKAFHQFSRMLSIIYIAILGIGLFETLTGIHLPQSGSYYYITTTSQFQPTGFLLNTNDFASEITILFPFVILTLLRIKKRWLCVFSILAVSSIALYLVIMTYSRVSMIVILLELFIFMLSWSRIWTIISLYVGGLATTLFLSIAHSNLINNVYFIIVKAFTEKGGSTSDRLEMYRISWKFIQENPIQGLGAGILPIKLDYYMYGFERLKDNYFSAHNYWLEALANGGLLAFVPLIIFFSLLFVYGIKFIFKNGFNPLTVIILLVLISFISASVGLSNTVDKRHLSLGIGLAISMLNIYYFRKGEPDVRTS
ncbi:Lipid A core - O-antigen ligase and related enzymes [Listeria fleischmannii subsp. fleischmannii]|uniref:Lipid A core - O-antigen ligase and related enzymes n=1 Tax=Listeria fleischmannii subsp. fleischmannii TaxID=1671902 RepID=A0A2X3JBE3_9LIST|nr:O-antigen ligase family protein [Listeria fleischmannii]SQC70399.1 Lipid A core - O-antigen ligase and related enzymes [Listeria fleischmannii subsp. fleischmannii]